jgi:hypothetical protein
MDVPYLSRRIVDSRGGTRCNSPGVIEGVGAIFVIVFGNARRNSSGGVMTVDSRDVRFGGIIETISELISRPLRTRL